MIMRIGIKLRVISLALLALCSVGAVQSQTSATHLSDIVGDWTGESICVGVVGACHDEKVIYHFSISKSDPQKLTLAADKIVNGRPEPMGEFDFTYDSANQILTSEFQNPRYHLRLEFTVKGNMMWGTMVSLPEKKVVRQMRVTKTESNQGRVEMTNHATGTFEVKLTPQDDKSEDKSLGRMTFEKEWQGDLAGSSKGQMLSGGDFKTGSAGYVAMEKFTGAVKGRKGTFILQHSATMNAGKGDLIISVVPNSGTEELKGIDGKLTIKIESGKHFYDFEYSLPQQ